MKLSKRDTLLGTLYLVWIIVIVVSIAVGLVWLISDVAHIYWALLPAGAICLLLVIYLRKSGGDETQKSDVLPIFIFGVAGILLAIGGVFNLRYGMTVEKCGGHINYICIREEYQPPNTQGFNATLARSVNKTNEYLLILSAEPYPVSSLRWEALGFTSVIITTNTVNGVAEQYTCKGRGAFWGDAIDIYPISEDSWEVLECPISASATDLGLSKFEIEVSYIYANLLEDRSRYENAAARNSFTLEFQRPINIP
jgi:hypothetical protein